MTGLANFLFGNIFFIILLIILYYIYHEYKELKKQTNEIKEIFDKTLDSYLENKITEAKNIADRIMKDHEDSEVATTEIKRLLLQIEKYEQGTINDKVAASNSLNKFKLSKKIDLEKYPYLKELESLGTFTEKDLNSLENGLAISRREYNAKAFRYNERANGIPIQYLLKFLKLNNQFLIFDAPKQENYEDIYEVFEEQEPEIHSLSSLNYNQEVTYKKEEKIELEDTSAPKTETIIDYSDVVLKPSIRIEQDITASDLIDNIELPKEAEPEVEEDNKDDKSKDKNKNKDQKKN